MRPLRPYLPSLLALAAVVAAWLVLRPGPPTEGPGEPPPPPPLDYENEREVLSASVAMYAPTPAVSLHDLSRGCQDPLGGLPGAAWLDVRPARIGPTARVIHVCDHPWVPRPLYEGRLPYPDFLRRLELVRLQQAAMLHVLAKCHGLREVWQGGLTGQGMPEFRRTVERLREPDRQRARGEDWTREGPPGSGGADARTARGPADLGHQPEGVRDGRPPMLLRLGAPAHLLARGELQDVLPLNDADLLPRPGAPAPAALESGKDRLVRAVLARGGTAVLVLDGRHDLADNIARLDPGCEYARVEPQAYRLLSGKPP